MTLEEEVQQLVTDCAEMIAPYDSELRERTRGMLFNVSAQVQRLTVEACARIADKNAEGWAGNRNYEHSKYDREGVAEDIAEKIRSLLSQPAQEEKHGV